jgi:predicted RNase H-like HicB family nuclease
LHDAFGYVGIGPLSVGQGQTPHEAKKNLKTAITARLDGILDEIEI